MGYPPAGQPWSTRGLMAAVIFALIAVAALLVISAVCGGHSHEAAVSGRRGL